MTTQQIDPTSPLSSPSHAAEHNALNQRVAELISQVNALAIEVDEHMPLIEHARLAAHTWVVRGTLPPVSDPPVLLLPIIWNMTGDYVEYNAAKATLYTPSAGAAVEIELVTGTTLTGGVFDDGEMTTILDSTLVIPAGETTSARLGVDDFAGNMADGSFVAAYIKTTGVDPDFGADLTIQLNRLL